MKRNSRASGARAADAGGWRALLRVAVAPPDRIFSRWGQTSPIKGQRTIILRNVSMTPPMANATTGCGLPCGQKPRPPPAIPVLYMLDGNAVMDKLNDAFCSSSRRLPAGDRRYRLPDNAALRYCRPGLGLHPAAKGLQTASRETRAAAAKNRR